MKPINAKALLPLLVVCLLVFVPGVSVADNQIPITTDNVRELRGWWEGKWKRFGSGGGFEIQLKEISETGEISGKRMYVVPNFSAANFDTVGRIVDGQIELDIEKGDEEVILLGLYEDKSGTRYLKGTYKTRNGDKVYKGKIKKMILIKSYN